MQQTKVIWGRGFCCCLVTQSCLTLCNPMTAAHQASLSITISWSLRKLMSIVSDAIQPSHPLLSLSPPPFSRSDESALCIRWPKYWNLSFSISPSNDYSGLISYRTDLVWSPCSPRDSHESSPTPQFKTINFLVNSQEQVK